MFKRCLVTLVLALFASMLVTACGQDSKPAAKKAPEQKVEKKDAAQKAEAVAKDAAAAAKDAAKEAPKKPVQGIPLPDNF